MDIAQLWSVSVSLLIQWYCGSLIRSIVDPGRVQDESLRSVQAVVAQMRGILIAGHETTTGERYPRVVDRGLVG
jgi:hypothetical protein